MMDDYYYSEDEYYVVDLDNLLGYNGSSGANSTLNESLGPCTSPCATEPCPGHSLGWDRLRRLFLPALYAGIFLVGAASNGLVVSVLWRKRRRGRLPTASDTFLLHLAAADLLLSCSMPFWAAEKAWGWVFGRALCKMVGSLYSTAFYGSVFLLVGISFERYLSVARAVKTRRRAPSAWVVCLAIWVICLALAIRDLVYLRPVSTNGEAQQCAHDYGNELAAVSGFYHLTGFLLPVAVMAFCYGGIGCTIARGSGVQRRKEWRAVRVAAAVVAAFLACWTPFNAALLTDTLHRLEATHSRDCRFELRLDGVYDLTRSLGDLHCCLNPFIYAFVGVRFRRELLRALHDWGVRCPARSWAGGRPQSSVSGTEQFYSSASFT